MLIYRVESEQELFDIVYDLVTYGRHVPNFFSHMDRNGMSATDIFDTLPLDMLERSLHIIDYDLDENGEEIIDGTLEFNERGRRKLRRNKMQFEQACHSPNEKDYPILLILDWEDGFDLKYRLCQWIPVINIAPVSKNGKTNVAKTYDFWYKRYGGSLCQKEKK